MSRQARGKVTRTAAVARDLTAGKSTEVKGGIVTNNKDPDKLYRYAAPVEGFVRTVGGLDSEAE